MRFLNKRKINWLYQLVLLVLVILFAISFFKPLKPFYKDNVLIKDHLYKEVFLDKKKEIKISHLIEIKLGVTSQLLIDEEEKKA